MLGFVVVVFDTVLGSIDRDKERSILERLCHVEHSPHILRVASRDVVNILA